MVVALNSPKVSISVPFPRSPKERWKSCRRGSRTVPQSRILPHLHLVRLKAWIRSPQHEHSRNEADFTCESKICSLYRAASPLFA